MNKVIVGNTLPPEILDDPEIIALFKPEKSSMTIVKEVVSAKDGPLGQIIISTMRIIIKERKEKFEDSLITIIDCTQRKQCQNCPQLDCIRVFVLTIGLEHFSENFQTLWQKLHPN